MFKMQMISEHQKLELKCKFLLVFLFIFQVLTQCAFFVSVATDRVLQKHAGLMDFFMENEELCTVQNLVDLQDGPQNQ